MILVNHMQFNFQIVDMKIVPLDERNRTREDYNPLEKVRCPECNNEVYKWINERTPCPKCGGNLLYRGTTHYD